MSWCQWLLIHMSGWLDSCGLLEPATAQPARAVQSVGGVHWLAVGPLFLPSSVDVSITILFTRRRLNYSELV